MWDLLWWQDVDQLAKSKQVRARLKALFYGCALVCALAGWCNRATAEEIVPPRGAAEYPTCRAGLRLSAVSYDAERAERSFALFGQQPRAYRRGQRVAGHEIVKIERGAVVLTSASQPCSLRLRNSKPQTNSPTIAVAEVRGALRARKGVAAAPGVPADALARRDAAAPTVLSSSVKFR